VIRSAAAKAGKLLAPMAPDALISQARRLARLEDFGEQAFDQPLARLCRGLDEEARLSSLGRIAARKDIVRMLANRLQIIDWRKHHPEAAGRPVARPLFIVGLPRTGTTILHNLMAQDPDSRCPLSWEVMYPAPPPETASFETDKRIARAERDMKWLNRLAPDFRRIHPVAARLPQECISITAHEFMSMQFPTMYRLPGYYGWLDGADKAPAYRFHKIFLQHLQARHAGKRWVLKAPGHLDALDALLAVYPDARIVQTHREPLDVVASLASLIVTLHRAFSTRVEPHEIGPDTTRRWAAAAEKAMADRDRMGNDSSRFLDIAYSDLIAEPIATVAGIYRHFDMPLTPLAKQRMADFLAANPKDKHGRHRYDLADFGLTREEERQRFARYRERYLAA